MIQETINLINETASKIKALESLATYKVDYVWIEQEKFCELSHLGTRILVEKPYQIDDLTALAVVLNDDIKKNCADFIKLYRDNLAKLIIL